VFEVSEERTLGGCLTRRRSIDARPHADRQRQPPKREIVDARGCTQRPAFQTSPHFLQRMYVTSGSVLALNTGSTAPHDGQAGEGGVLD